MAHLSERIERKLEESSNINFGVSRKIEAILGGSDLAPRSVGQVDLGDTISDPFDRLTIASANTLREKMDAWTRRHPNGELVRVPGTGELLARKEPSESFGSVEGAGFEPINDIVDFVGEDLGSIAGEVIATIGTRGANLLPFLARLFGGAAVGELGQQGVQELQGIQSESLGDVSGRALAKGVLSSTFGAAGVGVGKLADVGRGGGFLEFKPGAEDAAGSISALRESTGIDIPGLTPGQASDNPLVQKIEGQAGATMPTLQRYFDQQNKATVDILNSLRSKDQTFDALKGSLTQAHNKMRGDILSDMRINATTLTDGGEAVKKGISEYDTAARFVVNEAYKSARKIEPPQFDISTLKGVADEVGTGVRAETAEGVLSTVSAPLDKELTSAINDIKNLNDSLPSTKSASGEVITSTDQLRAIRSRLWDLKTPPPGEIMRQEHFQAGKVYNAITATLKNPINKNSSFVKAWSAADKEAAKRFDTMEKIIIMQAAKSETPAQLALRLAQPNQIDNIKMLRSVLPSKRFSAFQDSFKLDLVSKADNISTRMAAFDKATLDSLLSNEEQRIFRKMGKNIDSLNSVKVKEIFARQTRIGSAIKDILIRKDTASIDKLSSLVKKSGGKAGPLGKSLRSGLIDNIAKDVIAVNNGVPSIDGRKLNLMLDGLADRGLNQFLTAGDMVMLRNLNDVVPHIRSVADTGTSMQAGEAAGGFRGALTGDVSGAAVRTVLEHMGIGRLMTSRAGRFLLIGTGKDPNIRNTLGRMSAALGLSLSDTLSLDNSQQGKLEAAIVKGN